MYRYRTLILMCTVVSIGLSALFTRKVEPIYKAHAMVSVGRYIPPVKGPTGKLLQEQTRDKNYIESQLPLLTSYTIADIVLANDPVILQYLKDGTIPKEIMQGDPKALESPQIELRSLMENPSFDNEESYENNLFESSQRQPIGIGNATPEGVQLSMELLQQYIRGISYEYVSNTTFVNVTGSGPNPGIAARIANTHAQAFIALVRAKLLDDARTNLAFLQERKRTAKNTAREARQALVEYAEENAIFLHLGTNDHRTRGDDAQFGSKHRLSTLVQNLIKVTGKRAEAESTYRLYQNTSGGIQAEANWQTRQMEIKLSTKEGDYRALKKAGVSLRAPIMEGLKHEIKTIKQVLNADKETGLRRQEIRFKALQEQERLMKEEIRKVKEDSVKESKTLIRFSLLTQEDRAARILLDEISDRLEELYVHLNNHQSHVQLIDKARIPSLERARRDYINLIIGALLGPLIGTALAFALDILDNTIRTVSDLQRVLNVPLLGIIPRFSVDLEEMIASNYEGLPEGENAQEEPAAFIPESGTVIAGLDLPADNGESEEPSLIKDPSILGGPSLVGAWSTDIRAKLSMPGDSTNFDMPDSGTVKEAAPQMPSGAEQDTTSQEPNTVLGDLSGLDPVNGKGTSVDGSTVSGSSTLITSSSLVLVSAPHSVESEAFRNVRTCVTYGCTDKPPKIILVTSGQKHDGKTTVSCNLAISLAQISERTLLLDADLRIPAVHKNFSLSRLTPGLSDYLRGFRDYSEVVFETPIPNLCLMLAGEPVPNPTELVGSKKMAELLELLSDEFDHIIIDSPPVMRVADAMLLSRLVEGVVLVVRSGRTPEPVAESACARLQQMDANILGAVLNDVQAAPGYRDAEYYYLTEVYEAPDYEEYEHTVSEDMHV